MDGSRGAGMKEVTCIVQFEGKNEETFHEMDLPYAPQFFIGQEVYLSDRMEPDFHGRPRANWEHSGN